MMRRTLTLAKKCRLSGLKVVGSMRSCPMFYSLVKDGNTCSVCAHYSAWGKNQVFTTLENSQVIPGVDNPGKEANEVSGVDVSRQVNVKKDEGFEGGISVKATTKLVTVTLNVRAIPAGGGKIVIRLPWGKIFGIAKSAMAKGGK